jgi:hypothetical protein
MFFRPAKISQAILRDKEKTDSFKLALKMVDMMHLFIIFLHLKKHVPGMNPE